jgi:hypothetical protein
LAKRNSAKQVAISRLSLPEFSPLTYPFPGLFRRASLNNVLPADMVTSHRIGRVQLVHTVVGVIRSDAIDDYPVAVAGEGSKIT